MRLGAAFLAGCAFVCASRASFGENDTPAGGKILLRVFCHAHGGRIILLLGGYDKGERSSPNHQQEQVAVARALKSCKGRQGAFSSGLVS